MDNTNITTNTATVSVQKVNSEELDDILLKEYNKSHRIYSTVGLKIFDDFKVDELSTLVPELNSTNEELQERLRSEAHTVRLNEFLFNQALCCTIDNFLSMKIKDPKFDFDEYETLLADRLSKTFLRGVIAERLTNLSQQAIDDLINMKNHSEGLFSLWQEAIGIKNGEKSECSDDLKKWLKENKLSLYLPKKVSIDELFDILHNAERDAYFGYCENTASFEKYERLTSLREEVEINIQSRGSNEFSNDLKKWMEENEIVYKNPSNSIISTGFPAFSIQNMPIL